MSMNILPLNSSRELLDDLSRQYFKRSGTLRNLTKLIPSTGWVQAYFLLKSNFKILSPVSSK